jgi:hypothetical protein
MKHCRDIECIYCDLNNIIEVKTVLIVRFRNVVFKEKHCTMDKVQQQDSSKCITPSSEPFGIDLWDNIYNCVFTS